MADVQNLARKIQAGHINGNALAAMMQRGELSKGERRKVTKIVQQRKKQESKVTELTERQKLRLVVKEKKALPKMSKEERKQKFGKDMDNEHEKNAANFTVCLGCRKRGHFVKDCPNKALVSVAQRAKEGPAMCFNCGDTEHTLKDCPKKRDPKGHLPFATCFICKQSGHISRDCPENANGLYPQGGCCHICMQKTHLAKDCPDRTEEDREAARRRREAQEDAEKGPRVKGLLRSSDGVARGDDDMTFDFASDAVATDAADSDADSDDGAAKKKKKSDKLKRKSETGLSSGKKSKKRKSTD